MDRELNHGLATDLSGFPVAYGLFRQTCQNCDRIDFSEKSELNCIRPFHIFSENARNGLKKTV